MVEAVLKNLLQEHLADFVKGPALQRADLSSFPLTFRNLELNPKKVQELYDDDNTSAVEFSSGKVGLVTVSLGWLGNIDVSVSDVELSFAFSPTKALKKSMAGEAAEQYGSAAPEPEAPPAPCAPRFCNDHDSSEKREKTEPCFKECKKCGIRVQSSYKDFQLCPQCSDKDQKCMICGKHAPKACNYIPPTKAGEPKESKGQANLPQPPPAGQGRRGQSRPDSAQDDASMYMNRRDDPSMYMNRRDDLNTTQYPATARGPPNQNAPGDNFSTQLPQGWGGVQNQRRPMGRGNMTARPRLQGNEDDGSIAGFLNFVVSDLWKTCNSDNRQLGSPERATVYRGGA